MSDDRHSRLSLLARFHLPRNMYYVPGEGDEEDWICVEADGTPRNRLGGDDPSCGRRVVHDLNPKANLPRTVHAF